MGSSRSDVCNEEADAYKRQVPNETRLCLFLPIFVGYSLSFCYYDISYYFLFLIAI